MDPWSFEIYLRNKRLQFHQVVNNISLYHEINIQTTSTKSVNHSQFMNGQIPKSILIYLESVKHFATYTNKVLPIETLNQKTSLLTIITIQKLEILAFPNVFPICSQNPWNWPWQVNLVHQLYLLPEILRGDDSYDQTVDVYAFTMIAYEIVSGIQPFSELGENISLLNFFEWRSFILVE